MELIDIGALRKSLKMTQVDFSKAIGIAQSYLSELERGVKPITQDVYDNLNKHFEENYVAKFISQKKDNISSSVGIIETRPRIPLNAAAGSVSVALSGIRHEDSEQLPFINAFSNYNYTILVKGDSMEPEFHSGDELACLQLKNTTSYIQWGRYHVLDTAQGVLVKRIYDRGESILCKSDNNELYPDFEVPKDEVFNLGLVIGMLRRY